MSTRKVQTVRGDVTPQVLGRTLTHEHLCMKFTHFYREPPREIENNFNEGITCSKVGYIRQYPYSSKYNLLLNDDDARDAVTSDVQLYKALGGGTIVENSTVGLERDIEFYKKVSETTDVHIVAGTGHYIADVQADNTLQSTKEDLYNHMLQEITVGCVDYPTVRAGFMGEIASVWPMRDFERKAISAAGELQAQIGCGVSFHPHRDPAAPFEILRLYAEAGGDVSKAVMSHLDRTLLDPTKLMEFSELGSYCQFDLFGVEVSYYQLNVDTDMPSDSQRMGMVRQLVDEGKEDKILLSHDIHTKHRLTKFGGHGYSHIITNVLPRLKHKGVTQEVIDQITIHNPGKWLTMATA
ncbi:phosphotriesterase-related protein isoform X1 [Bicyclus anynana]|uniref:Phosphotriesterase-related protein n=1 Tax=Bicyclus anynana TaxID=110368 RepID=A0ABM3LS20_BICAN|nr:phosphotriesterase-related protein isoform X1 [Bicyclus anynana]